MAAAQEAAQPPQLSVDVTRENFKEMLPVIEDALKTCTFFSMDCEMTGLATDFAKEEYLDDYQDRYSKMASNASSFVVTQVGLSCFAAQRDGSYEARTFNVYVFPEPREGSNLSRKFVCDAGSLSFLAKNHFNFQKWICQGVPYMSARERDEELRKVALSAGSNGNGNGERNEVVPTNPNDIAYVAQLVQQVKEWMAGEEPTLTLPYVNRYQRLLCYQELEKPQYGVEGHTGFFYKKVTSDGGTQVQLLRGSPEQCAVWRAEEAAEQRQKVLDAAGFCRVFDAIRAAGKPCVGHNCMLDVAFTLAMFADSRLPQSLEGFKALAANWFKGGLYDTKHLCNVLLKEAPEVLGSQGDTWLGAVYKNFTAKDSEGRKAAEALAAQLSSHLGVRVCLPEVRHAPGYEKYVQVESGGLAHEAGYDAFMTGVVFAHLAPLVHASSARARGELQQPAAAAAAADSAAGAGEDAMAVDAAGAPAAAAASEQLPVQAAAADAEGDWDTASHYNPLDFAARYMGRLNVVRSDFPYLALWGADPPLPRPNVFYVVAPQGSRFGDVQRKFREAGVPKIRVNNAGPGAHPGTFLVEINDPEAVTVVMEKLVAPQPAAGSASGASSGEEEEAAWKVLTWVQWAAIKKRQPAQRGNGGGGQREFDRPPVKRPRPAASVYQEAGEASAGAAGAAAAPGAGALEGLGSHSGRVCTIM